MSAAQTKKLKIELKSSLRIFKRLYKLKDNQMILNNEEKKNLVDSLSWMIMDMKHKFDEAAFGGGYSKELNTAIDLLNDIKKTETVETTGCHRRLIAVNCREFKCDNNKKGLCIVSKVTLESIGSIVGMLKCVEAQEKSEEEK